MPNGRRTWAEIDLDRIAYNFKTLRAMPGGGLAMAVVKANAYGHGDIAVSRLLERCGADWFAVSNYEEAVRLRDGGIARPILILGYTPPDRAAGLAEHGITQALYSSSYAQALNSAASDMGVRVQCHVKIDTGMGRIGFPASEGAEDGILSACALPGLACTGIFTHFACADEPCPDSDAFTRAQFDAFCGLIARLDAMGLHFPIRHCCNSAAAMRFPEMHLDMVRLGIALYGLPPSPECAGLAGLLPAMSFYSTVSMVKEVPAGTPVSYGRTYTVPAPSRRLATVAVGYADGYRRAFSNRGHVLLHGKRAPVVGRVCMDQMLADVTDIPETAAGDTVTLAGTDSGQSITFDDFAALNGTINYEETCLIGPRVPRVYIAGGKEAGEWDCLA